MLIRLEQAPERSPRSFSQGGGFRSGSERRSSRRASAFFFRPLRASFFASLCAGVVKTTRQGRRDADTYQPGFSEVFESGVFSPFRIEARMPGTESR